MSPSAKKFAAQGFSLVEVMVAVIVICVGLLGIAKMQALALNNTSVSRQRSLVAIQAASLAASMHANRLYWGGNSPPATTTYNPAAAPQIGSTDAGLQTGANGVLTGAGSCIGTLSVLAACPAPLDMASYDLGSWAKALSGVVPNPQVTINCGTPAGSNLPPSCTIYVSWTEHSVGINNDEANYENGHSGTSKFETINYQLYVEP
jgi:type IV pilus assembly protein PilV